MIPPTQCPGCGDMHGSESCFRCLDVFEVPQVRAGTVQVEHGILLCPEHAKEYDRSWDLCVGCRTLMNFLATPNYRSEVLDGVIFWCCYTMKQRDNFMRFNKVASTIRFVETDDKNASDKNT